MNKERGNMKIVIIGGHLTPALSVIEKLPKESVILYVGRKYAIEGDKAVSLEYETITKDNISFEIINTGRLQRSITRHTIPSLAKTPAGLYSSLKILKKFKPDVVVGFGGYVSFPVVLAARMLRIPVVLHEQTLEAGASNRALAKFATKICISFESSEAFFPSEKIVLTGNPVRSTVTSPDKKYLIESKNPIIYITGGSLGAHSINMLVSKCLAKLVEKYTVIHQTGTAQEFKDYEKLSILKEGLNNDKRNRYFISRFFSPGETGSIMKQASLVVSRAGVNTVTELILLKKPAFLIPLPISQKDEQLKNALYFKSLGLGEVGDQSYLTPDEFVRTIDDMLVRIDDYKLTSSKNLHTKNAAEKIVEVIYATAKNSN